MVVSLASHGAAFVAFLLLTGLILVTEREGVLGHLLLAAVACSALWAGVVALATVFPEIGLIHLAAITEMARTSLWLVFIGSLVARRMPWFGPRVRVLCLVALAVIAIPGTAAEFVRGTDIFAEGPNLPASIGIISRLALAVIGLLLLENIFRNAPGESLWSLKHLILGAGLMFGYDFYLFSDALLFNRLDPSLFAARGAVNVVTVPLIAIAASRNHDWSVEVHISRQAVFHTATVVGSGIYLIVMAAAGYYLREIGGEWGTLAQMVFFATAVAVILVALFSETLRAWLRLAISRNFFSHRYDYRAEWLRFIDTLSSASGPLHDRAIRAVANIVESPAGAIWVRRIDEDQFQPAATWNFPKDLPHVAGDSPLVTYLAETRAVIDLTRVGEEADDPAANVVPEWLHTLKRAWLVVPCAHRDRVQGFILLGKPRAPQTLQWEDLLLLKTVGLQIASYLAEEEALKSLVDAQNLKEFNRRFAFVVHDIKNIVSQLSLMMRNAEKHRHNPEFQEDLMTTVQHTVEKMHELLGQLQLERARIGGPDVGPQTASDPEPPAAEDVQTEVVALGNLLPPLVDSWAESGREITYEPSAADLSVLANIGHLETVLRHLLQNAFEAAGENGNVAIETSREGDMVYLDIIDDGPGMDADFIRDHLFKPLHTTKSGGSGLGTYQARHLVNEMGGKLEVMSAPQVGTTMRIGLAAAEHPAMPLRKVGS
ncbi:MAG: PEP-CTERM system histidine kinase PrsK [Rhodospirillaceae bacterium]|nr:PEP-CTERM system histidine kinase PrsK [Rhodospirillaceae bacterium]